MGPPVPGRWRWDRHPWLKEPHDFQRRGTFCIVQKAAQMGFTEVGLNQTFYSLDILNQSVLYVLPANKPDAHDFSTSRFEPALEMSPHLSNLFTDTKNVHHKRAGTVNLFVRGSRSRTQLKSQPVAGMAFDEVDEMDTKNIRLAIERPSGQDASNVWFYLVSTPSIMNRGINYYFRDSTQAFYAFKCPHCSRWTMLEFPDCLVITAEDIHDPRIKDSYYICKECCHRLDHATKPEWLGLDNAMWVDAYQNRDMRGYTISQMYSTMYGGQPEIFAKKALAAKYRPEEEQELFNSNLGKVHETKGARISETEIDECIGGYVTKERAGFESFTTMGVDVGSRLHVTIDEWTFDMPDVGNDVSTIARCRTIYEATPTDFAALDALMYQFKINFCVVDANPETRMALQFARRFPGYVALCYYSEANRGKQLVYSEEQCTVTADRTSWMDVSLGRFRAKTIKLPRNLTQEYRSHLKSPVRITMKDRWGNPVGRYVTADSDEDHFAHSRNYSEIALNLGRGAFITKDIKEPVL